MAQTYWITPYALAGWRKNRRFGSRVWVRRFYGTRYVEVQEEADQTVVIL